MPEKNWLSAEEILSVDDVIEVIEADEEEDEDVIVLVISDSYPEWHAEAACLGQHEAADKYFYGNDDSNVRPSLSTGQIKKAREFCRRCTVVEECLTTAISSRERYGIWGGSTGRFRRQLAVMMDEGYIDLEGAVEECIRRLDIAEATDEL